MLADEFYEPAMSVPDRALARRKGMRGVVRE
jgi:hypothetical protein